MMSKLRSLFGLFRDAFKEWRADEVPRLASSLAYYTTFSIAPLLIVVVAIAGLVFGQDAVSGRLDEQIQGLVGRESADFVQEIIKNSAKANDSILATIIGLVTLLLGAAGVFGQLKYALNKVWGVAPKPGRGILGTLKDQFMSFGMVLGVGFLLIVSLVVSAGLTATSNFVTNLLPGMLFLGQLINVVVSFGIITLLFAMLYKFLPDTKIEWRDVFIGAALTSLLFTIGKQLLGLYLGNSGVASPYGAAGSFVIILVWIYYSAQIFLFGAEFTQVYAQRHGSRPAVQKSQQPETAAAQQTTANLPGKPATSTALMVIDKPTIDFIKDQPQPVYDHKSRWRISPMLGPGITFASFIALLVAGAIEGIRTARRSH